MRRPRSARKGLEDNTIAPGKPSSFPCSHPPPTCPPIAIGWWCASTRNPGQNATNNGFDRLVALFQREGFTAEVSSDSDQAAPRPNAWHVQGRLRALVGVGGDGTAAELVNRTPAGAPITMLPSGTENLLARHFRLGQSPERGVATVAGGRRISWTPASPPAASSCSWPAAADAEIVRRVPCATDGPRHLRQLSPTDPRFAAKLPLSRTSRAIS